MKILYASDIHASKGHLSSMLKTVEKELVDCVIIGGDLIPHSPFDNARFGMINSHTKYIENVFLPALKDFQMDKDIKIFLDLGNDDYIYNRSIFEEHDGDLFHLIHFKKCELTDEVDIIGYMNVPPTPFKLKDWEIPDSNEVPYAPDNRVTLHGYISTNGLIEETALDLDSKETIESGLRKLSEKITRPFIFVSHSPPFNTLLDVIHNGNHVGSDSIRRFIEKWAEEGLLLASFHGHIHKSPQRSGSVIDKIGAVPCLNPGQGTGKGSDFRYVTFQLSKDRIIF